MQCKPVRGLKPFGLPSPSPWRLRLTRFQSSHSEPRPAASTSAYHSTAVDRHHDIRLLVRRCSVRGVACAKQTSPWL